MLIKCFFEKKKKSTDVNIDVCDKRHSSENSRALKAVVLQPSDLKIIQIYLFFGLCLTVLGATTALKVAQ